MRKLTPKFHEQVNKFIEEYVPYIRYCYRKKSFLKDHYEDIEQFVITELIANFHKKKKFTDFDFVVRTIIRRKILDYTSMFMKKDFKVVTRSSLACCDLDNNKHSEVDEMEKDLSEDCFKQNQKNEKIIELLKEIDTKMRNKPLLNYFSDWDREFFEVIMELYNLGWDIKREDLLECMGYGPDDQHTFSVALKGLQNKLAVCFSMELEDVISKEKSSVI